MEQNKEFYDMLRERVSKFEKKECKVEEENEQKNEESNIQKLE